MAKLELRQIWINLLSTGAAVHGYSADRSRSTGIDGEVRKYAGGRMRAVSSAGTRGQFAFKLRDISDTDIETLKSWYGLPVVLRDHRGRRYFGVFFDIQESEPKDINYYDAALVLQEVTYVEGV